MKTIQALMAELDGADAATVQRVAWEQGPLPVRLAMLGLASARKQRSPLWWAYPPGVFIGYKWDGPALHTRVAALASFVRGLGYRALLDTEALAADADAYGAIPQFITSLQDCMFYVLLLTETAADMIDARGGKTTWIHDEYQHALRLADSGRLFIVPLLLEAKGMLRGLTREQVIDMTAAPQDWPALKSVLTAQPLQLDVAGTHALAAQMAQFDRLFLGQQWDASLQVLQNCAHLEACFDHGLRHMLHALYTADRTRLDGAVQRLHAAHGAQAVQHIYRGYCKLHGIPDRS